MIEWREEAVLIGVKAHGESAAIIDVFTAKRGRMRGLVRGGQSRKMRPILQIGAQLDVAWKARLETHLGALKIEPIRARLALMGDGLRLTALNALAEMLCFSLPEGHAYPDLFEATLEALDALNSDDIWFDRFLGWELIFLQSLGFGLNLERCTVTGQDHDLVYISPKTGCAVSREGAGKWAPELLAFPPALKTGIGANRAEFRACLELTEYFLARYLIPSLGGKAIPAARQRMAHLVLPSELAALK